MNDLEVLDKIKDIIFSVPGGLYKFQPPDDCFEGEWEEASVQEKAFLLIEELLLNLNVEKNKKKQELDLTNLKEIEISECPRFYGITDENMFFEALKSIPKILDIKGRGRSLFLYYRESLSIEEKEILKVLFKRYQVPMTKEFED